MIDVITSQNAYLYREVLDDMFRMRHRVLCDQWGWRVPGMSEGYDRDEFDTEDTIYFVKQDDAGRVIATARINPTLKPHMLSEVFPDACDQRPVPRAADTYELTRYVVDKHAVSNRDFIAVAFGLLAGVTEFCEATGIRNLSWYAFQLTYALSLQVWKTSPLGRPQTHEGDEAVYIPAISGIDAEAVIKTRAKARLDGPASRYVAPLPVSAETFGTFAPGLLRAA
jgi:acyl-homoserine lactone synthase